MPIWEAAFGRIWPHALRAVSEGIGVTAARQALRFGGLHFRNSAFSQAYKLAVRLGVIQRHEAGANLSARPGGRNILRGPWKTRRKYAQYVRLDVRNKVTGEMKVWTVPVDTDRLMTRSDAIVQVTNKVAPDLANYDFELVGVGYDHTRSRA